MNRIYYYYYYYYKTSDFPNNKDNKTKIRNYGMEEKFCVTLSRTYDMLYQGYR